MGSAVTVFMDVPKDERGEILFSPTRAGCGDVPDVPDDVVVDDDGAVVLDSPREGADRPGDTAVGDGATRREVASLRRDLRREQTRAREADDRAARAEMAAERADLAYCRCYWHQRCSGLESPHLAGWSFGRYFLLFAADY